VCEGIRKLKVLQSQEGQQHTVKLYRSLNATVEQLKIARFQLTLRLPD